MAHLEQASVVLPRRANLFLVMTNTISCNQSEYQNTFIHAGKAVNNLLLGMCRCKLKYVDCIVHKCGLKGRCAHKGDLGRAYVK